MPAILNITKGQRFGRLAVIRRVHVPGCKNVMWECRCDCGNITTGAAANLGKTKLSCGCLAKETAADLLRGNTHRRTHNKSKSSEYQTWVRMKDRCYNENAPKYSEWGGRGITVCARWRHSFENFLADMGPRPSRGYTIERENNHGNYTPKNCVWATHKTQSRNTRRNHMITIDGRTMCIAAWCEEFGIPRWKPTEAIRRRKHWKPQFETMEEAMHHLVKSAQAWR